jgi:adenylate cyclase
VTEALGSEASTLLDAWRHDLFVIYLSLIIGAFLTGQLRNRLER